MPGFFLNLRIPNGKLTTFILDDTNETIRDIYRFIRDIGEKNYLLVREFLYTFEKARKYNRKLLRENPMSKKIKPVFSNYDIFNRSTDNQQSHQERYKILTSMFTYYSKYKKLPVS